MRRKLALLILIALVLLVACQEQPTPTPAIPAVEPSITGLAVPEIDQATADAIRQNMALFLRAHIPQLILADLGNIG